MLETHTTIIKRDEELWNSKLKPCLLDFASALKIFMEDTELQKKFIEEGSDKLSIIKSIDIS